MKYRGVILAALAILLLVASEGWATRIKDIADLQGVRDNQLYGYGLVVGLDDTGDGDTGFTRQSLTNMLQRLNISTDLEEVDVDNVAAVMVTAKLPPFAKPGERIDVVVSSVGDAESLVGGTLMQTPLQAADGKVYAVAQGPLAVGGVSFGGAAARVQKNHPTVARISEGAIVEREVPYELPKGKPLTYRLQNSDFTTVSRITSLLNKRFGNGTATARDSGCFRVRIPQEYENRTIDFIAAVERLQVRPDAKAKVVVNERTGTIVMGQNVRLSKVAVAHGNLKLIVQEHAFVSQPPALSGGETVAVPETEIDLREESGNLMVMEKGVNIGDIASALNAIGASTRDLISIFQAIKAAGALHAELVIM
jgi:flagellar P-ring protein precursor FlgI